MKFFKQPLLTITLLSILSLLFTADTYAQTVYDWTGAVNTSWTTPGNWQVLGVTQTTNYPGISATDIADIGVVSYYHFVPPSTTRQPQISSGTTVSLAAINFGDNGVPAGVMPGSSGVTGYESTLTVTGILNVSGAITQNHSTQGIASSGNTASPYTYNILNAIQGAGTVTCASLNIGDNTTPTNNYVIGVTKFRIGYGNNMTFNVTGNITCNSPIYGDGTAANNIISESFAELSISGGTLNLTGQIILKENTSTFTAPASQYSPLAFFSMDLYKTAFGPTLNLYNTSPFSIQTGAVRNNIDFYNVTQAGGTGTSTVNYAATSGTQDIATYKAIGGIYNNFIDHFYTMNNVIATTSGLVGGSGYVDGSYTNVPVTGGTGSGAMANITISGGIVTSATILSGYDSGYAANDVLSASNTNLGGSGSGFSITVASITSSASYAGVYQNVSFAGGGTKAAGVASGNFSVLGNFTVSSGTETVNVSTNTPTLAIGGNLTIGSGATLIKSDGTTLTIQGTTINGGTFTHSGSATVTFNGAFTNQSTGTYAQSGSGNVVFNNYAMTNSGTYNQSSTGTVTINNTFSNASGGIYNRSGSGAFTAASTTTNAGTFNQSSATVATFTGAVTNTGTMYLTGSGNILFSAAYTSTGSSSLLSQTGTGNLVFSGDAANGGTISQGSGSIGTISIAGQLTNSGTFTQQGGTVSVTGAVTNSSGATLTLGSTTFTMTGDYTNNGTFAAGTGTAVFNGTTTQHLKDGSTNGTRFGNVLFSGNSNKNMQNGAFYVLSTGVMTLSGNNTHVVSSAANDLTLISDVNGSATLAALPTGCTVNGTVTVQRYVSANRAYRLMSSPVYVGTDGNSNNYYGVNYLLTNTVLTGTNFPNNGVSSKSGNPTLYLWRENLIPQYTTFLNSNFIGIADITNPASYVMNDATYTNTDIPVGNGYLFYFRGSIKQKNLTYLTTAGVAATTDTLNAVGTINYGNITVHPWYLPTSSNLGWSTTDTDPSVQGINLVGNPYPSSIDWDQYGSGIAENNVASYCYQLIPTGAQGAGNYNVYIAGTNIGGDKEGTQPTPNSNIIASGEGFLVQALNSSASLTFTEAAKTNKLNTGASLYMGKPPVAKVEQYIHLQLAMDSINTDGTIIEFNASAKPTYDPKEDAHYKIGTGKVSLSSLSSDNAPIAFNQLPLALRGDTIHLAVGAKASGTYKFNVKAVSGIPQLYNVYLADALTKDTTDLRKTASYSFTVNTADTTTLGNHRFSVIINQNPLLEYKLLTFTANQVGQSKHVQLGWTTVNEQNYTYFTVERSNDNGKTFNVAGGLVSTGAGQYGLVDKNAQDGDNLYRLKQVDFNNNTTYSDVIHVQITERGNKDHFTCFPNPAISTINLSFVPKSETKTTYDLKISNSSGIVVKYAVLTDTSWQGNVSNFMTGSYLIQVTDRNDNSIIGQAKFVKL